MDCSLNTKSYERFADGYIVTRSSLRWAWEQYLHEWAEGDHPYASPLRAQSLDGLPPALIITAEHDPLCDEGEAYGSRLESEGVPVAVSRYRGMVHTFFSTDPPLDATRQARNEAAVLSDGRSELALDDG